MRKIAKIKVKCARASRKLVTRRFLEQISQEKSKRRCVTVFLANAVVKMSKRGKLDSESRGSFRSPISSKSTEFWHVESTTLFVSGWYHVHLERPTMAAAMPNSTGKSYLLQGTFYPFFETCNIGTVLPDDKGRHLTTYNQWRTRTLICSSVI